MKTAAAATYDTSVLHGVWLPTDDALLQQQSGNSASSSSPFPFPPKLIKVDDKFKCLLTDSNFSIFIRLVRWVEFQVGWSSNARHLCPWSKLIGLNLTTFQWHFQWIWVKNDPIFIRIVGGWNWNWVEVKRSSIVSCKFVDWSVRCLLLLKIVQFHPISVN